jgi:hypothetical protein
MNIVSPIRLQIREAQTLIGQARVRTQLSIETMLETANRILAFQLQSPDLVLDGWVLYQRLVTPTAPHLHVPALPRETRAS